MAKIHFMQSANVSRKAAKNKKAQYKGIMLLVNIPFVFPGLFTLRLCVKYNFWGVTPEVLRKTYFWFHSPKSRHDRS
jgi:hypothetical protein